MSLFPKFSRAKANTVKGSPITPNNSSASATPVATVNSCGSLTVGTLSNANLLGNSNWSNVSCGTTVSFNSGYQPADDIAKSYFRAYINRKFADRSFEFREKLFELFTWKLFEEIHRSLMDTFSEDGIEFLKEMSDEEIINYLKITE